LHYHDHLPFQFSQQQQQNLPQKHSKEEKDQKPQTLKHPFKIPKPLSSPFYGFLTSLQNPKTPFKAFLWFFNIPSKSQNPFQGLLYGFLTSLQKSQNPFQGLFMVFYASLKGGPHLELTQT
jgi:hypothetical protein